MLAVADTFSLIDLAKALGIGAPGVLLAYFCYLFLNDKLLTRRKHDEEIADKDKQIAEEQQRTALAYKERDVWTARALEGTRIAEAGAQTALKAAATVAAVASTDTNRQPQAGQQ